MPGNLFQHVMRKEKVKHLVTVGIIEAKEKNGKTA